MKNSMRLTGKNVFLQANVAKTTMENNWVIGKSKAVLHNYTELHLYVKNK